MLTAAAMTKAKATAATATATTHSVNSVRNEISIKTPTTTAAATMAATTA